MRRMNSSDPRVPIKATLRYLQDLGVPDLPRPRAVEELAIPMVDPVPVNSPEPISIKVMPQTESLASIQADLVNCQRCQLAAGRTNIVFGVGNPQADLMFIGEGPGRDEDSQGEPFVGRAGQLLTKMIQAMGLKREDVYIANIVKCRPPNNRNPEPDEMATCSPFLLRQIQVIQPKMMVCLGSIAVKSLLQTSMGITRLRGQFHEVAGIQVMPTFHPAYLLRNAEKKKEAWEDLQKVMKELGLGVSPR